MWMCIVYFAVAIVVILIGVTINEKEHKIGGTTFEEKEANDIITIMTGFFWPMVIPFFMLTLVIIGLSYGINQLYYKWKGQLLPPKGKGLLSSV